MRSLKKRGLPGRNQASASCSQPAQGERHCRLRKDIEKERPRSEQPHIIAARGFMATLARHIPHSRVLLQETEEPKKKTRRRDEIKCPTPTQMKKINQPAPSITERAADRNRCKKNGEHTPARRHWKKIGNDWWRRRTISAFSQSINLNAFRIGINQPELAHAKSGEHPHLSTAVHGLGTGRQHLNGMVRRHANRFAKIDEVRAIRA